MVQEVHDQLAVTTIITYQVHQILLVTVLNWMVYLNIALRCNNVHNINGFLNNFDKAKLLLSHKLNALQNGQVIKVVHEVFYLGDGQLLASGHLTCN